ASDRDALYDRYLTALVADLRRQVAAGPAAHAPPAADLDPAWRPVTSVFIGGGTPTLIGGERLAQALATIRAELDVAAGVEITVE
ncbi:MAG: hypothetical protein WD010_05810, partial [Nitriliruptor sp.]